MEHFPVFSSFYWFQLKSGDVIHEWLTYGGNGMQLGTVWDAHNFDLNASKDVLPSGESLIVPIYTVGEWFMRHITSIQAVEKRA